MRSSMKIPGETTRFFEGIFWENPFWKKKKTEGSTWILIGIFKQIPEVPLVEIYGEMPRVILVDIHGEILNVEKKNQEEFLENSCASLLKFWDQFLEESLGRDHWEKLGGNWLKNRCVNSIGNSWRYHLETEWTSWRNSKRKSSTQSLERFL